VNDTEGEETRRRRELLSEIDEEVRRRRSEGELLPSLERQLDEAFERLAPDRSARGGTDAAIELAERAGHVDVEAPVASNLLVGEVPKRLVRRATSWYLGYVVQQLTRFTSATTNALHSIDRRLSELERDAEVRRRLLAGRHANRAAADPTGWTALLTGTMSDLEGRVLHAECGEGALLRDLADAGVDVYGVDPRPGPLDVAARVGVDVRLTTAFEDLAGSDESSLGGVIVSGFVDHLTVGGQSELLELCARALRAGGILALLCVNPDAWGRSVSPVDADLSPGRPLHAETWAYLLERHGFSSVIVQHTSPTERLQPVQGSGPAWDAVRPAWEAVSSNLARLDQLLFPPPSFAVLGTRRD
jgi:SAM-dependent methyltransferase